MSTESDTDADGQLADSDTPTPEVIEPGQTWRCNEDRADPADVPEPHDVPLWEPYPRFTASVVCVYDEIGMVELSVAYGNSHPRTPDYGATVDVSLETLREDPRWHWRPDR